MEKWILYRHTSPSGKVYIGITSRSPLTRWGKNGCRYKGSTYFVAAIQKYGWDNILHEVLFTDLSEEQAKKLEIDLIRHYKNLGISYNMTDGGNGTVGYHPSEESRKKMSEAQRRVDKHLRAAILNENREQIGIKHRKPVVQFTLQGEYIATYAGSTFASAITNIDASMITACCKGKQYRAGNYIWMYESQYNSFVLANTLNNELCKIISKATQKAGTYVRTEEWRKNMSNKLKEKPYIHTEARRLGNIHRMETSGNPVMQLTKEGVPVCVFRSSSEVKRKLGFCNSYIGHCCNGHKKEAYGFKWKYITKEEYNEYKDSFAA